MAWMANKLRNRIQLKYAVQTPESSGGLDKTYVKLLRLWAEIIHMRTTSTNNMGYEAWRNVSADDVETHQFKVRYGSTISKTVRAFAGGFDDGYDSKYTDGLSRAFSLGYSTAFNSILDMDPIKANYFVFLENGSQIKGKLFRIRRIIFDEIHKEWILINCSAVDERGTGFNE
jgi:head-tail adaptor